MNGTLDRGIQPHRIQADEVLFVRQTEKADEAGAWPGDARMRETSVRVGGCPAGG